MSPRPDSHDLPVHRMAVLLAVHRAGGVVAAAEPLGLSASAVSQQVRLLEKEVGASLLDRTPTGAVLTTAGRVLADAAERIEAEVTAARRELAALDEATPSGTLRVGAFATAIRALLLPLMEALEASHPGIELIVEEVEEKAGIAALRHGELDLVLLERDLHMLTPPPRGLADVTVLDESWLVVVPPATPVPERLSDLAGATWIGLDPGTAGARALDRVEHELGAALQRRHVGYDFDVVLAMVSHGLGCALLPELAVKAGYVPQDVAVVRLPGLGTRQLVARHRSTRLEPGPAVRAVVAALREHASTLAAVDSPRGHRLPR